MYKKVLFCTLITVLFSTSSYASTNLQKSNISIDVPDVFVLSEDNDNSNNNLSTFETSDYQEQLWVNIYPYPEGLASTFRKRSGLLYETFFGTDEYRLVCTYDLETILPGFNAELSEFISEYETGALHIIDSHFNTGECLVDIIYAYDNDNSAHNMSDYIDVMSSIKISDENAISSSEELKAIYSNVETPWYDSYPSGMYKIGIDMPPGEYILYTEANGYFCISSDSNQDDIKVNGNFSYNSIVFVEPYEYLDLKHCYAVPISAEPDVVTTGEGMFKVGLHIPAGEYKLQSDTDHGYYCIYPSSRQDNILSNDVFDGQKYVTVKDGQYLELHHCHFIAPPSKPIKTYNDYETVKKVQSALNNLGYDCAPGGMLTTGTITAIETYQSENGLTINGLITDELLSSLGIK